MWARTTQRSRQECLRNFVVHGLDHGVTIQKSRLNYEVIIQEGKRIVVHVIRLMRAYRPVEGQEPRKGMSVERLRQKRRQPEEEEEPKVFSPGPIATRAAVVENRPPELRSPVRDRQVLDASTVGPSSQEAPSNYRVDPTYVLRTPLDSEERWEPPEKPLRSRDFALACKPCRKRQKTRRRNK